MFFQSQCECVSIFDLTTPSIDRPLLLFDSRKLLLLRRRNRSLPRLSQEDRDWNLEDFEVGMEGMKPSQINN